MSNIKTYIKRPVKIQAMEYTYPASQELKSWLGTNAGRETSSFGEFKNKAELQIKTLEDGTKLKVTHIASEGDMIIRGVEGEFYACKPGIFKKTYFDSKDQ